MEIKASRTEKNLLTAFAGESQARNRYTFFASKARSEKPHPSPVVCAKKVSTR